MSRQIIFLSMCWLIPAASFAQRTVVTGEIANLSAKTIKCSIIPNTVLDKIESLTIPVSDGQFHQVLPLTEVRFISFEEGNNYYGGFIQPGDSIHITYDAAKLKTSLSYSGKGKEKLVLSEGITQLRAAFSEEMQTIKLMDFPVDSYFKKVDSLQVQLTNQLNAARTLVSEQSYQLLYGYIQANALRTKYNGLINIFGDSYDNVLTKHKAKLTPFSKKAIQDLLKPDEKLSYSWFYVTNLSNILSVHVENNIQPGDIFRIQQKYSFIRQVLPPALKSPAVFVSIDRDLRQDKSEVMDSIIEESFPNARDTVYKHLLTSKLQAARALKAGIPAPDFSLENLNGETVNLSSFKGKVIYLDFWFAACAPCHQLFNDTRQAREFFSADSNVVFLIVSIDGRETWEKAVKKFNLIGYHTFTGNKFRAHPIIKDYNVNGYPTTYLIDKNAKIFSIQPARTDKELIREIQEALKDVDR